MIVPLVTATARARQAARVVRPARARHAAPRQAGMPTLARHPVLVCLLLMWLAWTYWLPSEARWLGRALERGDIWGASCATTIAAAEEEAGLVGLAHDLGSLDEKLDVTAEDVHAWMVSGARLAGRVWRAFQGAQDGEPPPVRPAPHGGKGGPVPLDSLQVDPSGGCATLTCPGAGPAVTSVSTSTASPEARRSARAILRAGARGEEAVTFVAIAAGESGHQPDARNPSSTARGTWQIMLSLHTPKLAGGRWDDPTANARAARAVAAEARSYGRDPYSPWVVYTTGKYREHLDEARAAVAAESGGTDCVTTASASSTDGLSDRARVAKTAALAAFGPMQVDGWAERSTPSEHDDLDEHGRRASNALDFMVDATTQQRRGDELVAWLLTHQTALHVDYIIWNRFIINPPAAPRRYYGASPHTDHVHVSFHPAVPGGRTA